MIICSACKKHATNTLTLTGTSCNSVKTITEIRKQWKRFSITNPSSNTQEIELHVFLHVQDDVYVSCKIEMHSGKSKSTLNRIGRYLIRKYHYHPYHIALHQELHGGYLKNRVNYCNTMLNRIHENSEFCSKILLVVKPISKAIIYSFRGKKVNQCFQLFYSHSPNT